MFRANRASDDDPDAFRMSVGDHLEELRGHLIKALVGVFVSFFGCLLIAKQHLLPFVAGPLIEALERNEVSPQLYQTGVADPFMVYLRLSMIGAFVLAGPWVIYQAWKFVAAGLYAKERKMVTRYLPMSLVLFACGIAFVWWLILPLTLRFFLMFSATIPLPRNYGDVPKVPAAEVQVQQIVQVAGDPEPKVPFQYWFDTTTQRLKMYVPNLSDPTQEGHVRVIPFGSENLVAPIITLPDYVSLVMVLLVVFGLSFQLPIVVMALVKTGLIPAQTMREQRRIVYFAIVFAACAITPGDVITATLGLIGPMILLFEIGIWLGDRGKPQAIGDGE